MTRRKFTTKLWDLVKVLPFATVFSMGCGGTTTSTNPDETSIPPTDNACDPDGVSTTIDTNHGHSLTVPLEDVIAGIEKIYNIQGTSSHNHTVTLSPTHFESLKQGELIQITSSRNGHTHIVSASC